MSRDELVPYRKHVLAVEPGGVDRRESDVVPDTPPPSGTERVMAALPDVVMASGAAAAGMGIRGLTLANIGNTTAMAVITMVFVWQLYTSSAESQSVRDLFRAELQTTRETQDRRFERVAEKVDRLATDQQQLTAEMRRLTDALYQTNRELRAIPKPPDPQSRAAPGPAAIPEIDP